MVTIKVFTELSDKEIGAYSALSFVEARSILLVSGFLDDNHTWLRRNNEVAVILPYSESDNADRVWRIP